ncbi:Fanconi anemia group E protein [Rana temporaria]|uniref:Fanconi anemia group E protein n=1 Tax=Rana temporaria TaxID=8407 RepID=UPI001AAD8DF4|nr:Fanconi anemia group E protein [Rana temporaria]XP_040193735.1 Fanconi anemia group E protein [Rana temporaria]
MAGTSLHDPERAVVLLLQALSNDQNGFLAAHRVLQCFPGPFPWISTMENLCMKVPTVDESTGEMIIKPKLALLPLQTQRNLFRLLDLMYSRLPAPAIQLWLQTISVENDFSDAWLLYMRQHFLTGSSIQTPLQSPEVAQSLYILCKQLNQTPHGHFKLGWYKNRFVSMEDEQTMDFESGPQIEDKETYRVNDDTNKLFMDSQPLSSLQESHTEAPEEMAVLPASIEAHVPKLKQFLYLNMESESLDHEFLAELNKLFDLCSPLQLETLFSNVGIVQLSLKCLFQLCVHLDTVSPDISYAHAKSLAKSLFLDRVLSLTSPASRTLTAALSMFCNKYAYSACSSLIGPILIQAEPGTVYADFLCRMVSECVQPHQLHLCFSPILDSSCTEVAIIILHLLIDKKDKFCQSEFDPLLNYLCEAAEKFSKSVTFSKLLLVLLTSKPNLIQLAHLGPLTSALNSNQTFMKKSLQNALRKVAEQK